MSHAYDGGSSLFSGGGFMPSQATQTPESGFSKSRVAQGILPLTVKQISEAYDSSDDKSNFVVDGVDATNVKLLGLMMNKAERITDVSFSLDDGTGRISVNRWVNETSDTKEMAIVQNGMYVTLRGSLKGFQGKKQVVAYSVRPVIDFNEVTLHYLECIHVHLDNTRPKTNTFTGIVTPSQTDMKGYQTPLVNKTPGASFSDKDIYKRVLDVFMEPMSSSEQQHGLHVDEVARRAGLPLHVIREAISYHVDIGHMYSTIDDYHYTSTLNG